MKYLLLCFLFLIGCGGSSSGQPCNGKECAVGVRLVHIQSEKSFNYQDAEKIVALAIEFLNANTTLDLVYKGGESIADPFPGTATLENWLKGSVRFNKLRLFLSRNNIGSNFKKREITIIIDQPLVDENGVIYTAGRSNICNLYKRGLISLTYATPFTNNDPNAGSYGRTKEEMIVRSANTTTHEIAHGLGARHKECEDLLCIMLPYSTSLVHEGLLGLFYVLPETNRETEVCTRRETRREILFCRRNTMTRKQLRNCKRKRKIKNIRLRDVKFKENQFRSIEHDNHIGCNLRRA
jgi:hypothetical protein